VDALAQQYGQFSDGLGQAAGGVHDLSDGTGKLNSGVAELYGNTRDMPETMQAKIDEFVKTYDFSGFEPHSFVSEQNQKVSLVQFVIKTPAIEPPDTPEDTDDTAANASQSFLDRLLALFGM
jgi:X-X-X-Leu-X-X-Gly heptad repeat protein